MLGWECGGGSVRVRTDSNNYTAGALIVCAGAWSAGVLRELELPLEVQRTEAYWLRSGDSRYGLAAGCPVFGIQTADGFFYGFPSTDGATVKVAEHRGHGVVEDPGALPREVHAESLERVQGFRRRYLPGVGGELVRHSPCMYTYSPDGHFIVDRHPAHDHVAFAAGFSGHGFKFAPVVGAALADLATEGATELPVGFLSLSRPALRDAPPS